MYSTLPTIAAPNFLELADVYAKTQIEFPHLRAVTLAQWGLESGWGKSALSQRYNNYAGMKWRTQMKPYGTPANYVAHDGPCLYVNFPDAAHFIAGYWKRYDIISNYDGWRKHTATPEQFIGFVGPIWLGLSDKENARYVTDVLRLKKITDKEFTQ